jgi:Uma2 family endonuclease
MLPDTVAPWAEMVLDTADDLSALRDDAWRYELVQGRLVRMPPTNYEHSHVGMKLLVALHSFAELHGLGEVTMAETGFLLSRPNEPDTVLAPDIAFLSASRVPTPGSPDWKGFPRLAPDLVVEIASPSQGRSEMAVKTRLWLAAGVRQVWVVWPAARQVDVWEPDRDTPTSLTDRDQLDGGSVLPGFTCPLAHILT